MHSFAVAALIFSFAVYSETRLSDGEFRLLHSLYGACHRDFNSVRAGRSISFFYEYLRAGAELVRLGLRSISTASMIDLSDLMKVKLSPSSLVQKAMGGPSNDGGNVPAVMSVDGSSKRKAGGGSDESKEG